MIIESSEEVYTCGIHAGRGHDTNKNRERKTLTSHFQTTGTGLEVLQLRIMSSPSAKTSLSVPMCTLCSTVASVFPKLILAKVVVRKL